MNILLKTTKIANRIEKKLNFKYYFLLSCSLMVYGHNDYLDLVSVITITLLFIGNLMNDNFINSYFALIFFEPILDLPFIGGSFFRIYQVFFIIRLLFHLNSKHKIRFYCPLNIMAAIVLLLFSIQYTVGIEGLVSLIINIFILTYIIMYKERNSTLNKIFAVIGIFVALSGIYGILFGIKYDYGYMTRIGSAIGDPNYSALFYTLGLFALLGTNAIDRKLRNILICILCVALFLTVSISGILGTLLLYVIYLTIIKIQKGVFAISLIALMFVIYLNLNFTIGNSLYGFQYRIQNILNSGELAVITSNRSTIASCYIGTFLRLPIIEQLIGGNNTVSGNFRYYMVSVAGGVSHNSYIDMLFMIGIIGTVMIVSLFLMMIFKNINQYRKDEDLIPLSMAFLKLTILYYSISISIFPFRYFLTFFIL